MVPVQSWEAAHDAGLVSSFQDLFDKGQLGGYRTMPDGSKKWEHGLSAADRKAIEDGADPIEIVNARRAGLRAPAGVTNAYTTEIFGHKVKATHYGATKRARWRKANPSRLVRLRPEAIYQIANTRGQSETVHDDAVRLLRLYGYIH